MFETIGRTLDNFIIDLKYFIRKYNSKTPWYKIYAYLFFKRKISQGEVINYWGYIKPLVYEKHLKKLYELQISILMEGDEYGDS